MQKLFAALLFFVSACSVSVAAPQGVGGLSVNYEQPFKLRQDVARAILDSQPSDIRKQVRVVQAFSAGRNNEITEISIIKTQYQPGAQFEIDGAALGAVETAKHFNGVSKAQHSIEKTRVSGHEARRVSFEADSQIGRFGLEALLIFDSKTKTLWSVTCTFGKRGVVLEPARKTAKSILASVSVAP